MFAAHRVLLMLLIHKVIQSVLNHNAYLCILTERLFVPSADGRTFAYGVAIYCTYPCHLVPNRIMSSKCTITIPSIDDVDPDGEPYIVCSMTEFQFVIRHEPAISYNYRVENVYWFFQIAQQVRVVIPSENRHEANRGKSRPSMGIESNISTSRHRKS